MYGAYPHPKTSLLSSSCWWWLGKAWRFYQPPSSSYQTLRLARPTSPIMSDPSSYRALLITIIIRVRGKPLASWDLEFFWDIFKTEPKIVSDCLSWIAHAGLKKMEFGLWIIYCGSYMVDHGLWIVSCPWPWPWPWPSSCQSRWCLQWPRSCAMNSRSLLYGDYHSITQSFTIASLFIPAPKQFLFVVSYFPLFLRQFSLPLYYILVNWYFLKLI